jgi:Lon protease (S16) C-terminal proteolytic domain
MSTSISTSSSAVDREHRLQRAIVLTELGSLREAELEVATVLEAHPEDLEALSLYAKLKHMRGELSLAVACVAQLHARNPVPGEVSRMHLESMLLLAQDPARGAGEFVAVGQFQLVRKPTAYLALETAFHHYVSRRPQEARAVCREVARRHQESDPGVYRLAVLADAWISELIGDLATASETLERLGAERGYETDLDRLMALVGLYERIGSRETLEAAVNICVFLERNHPEAAQPGRLAVLHRRLGQPELAAECEIRHEAAFQRRMHRASLADVLQVAGREHVSLARLRGLPLQAHDSGASRTRREEAIARALEGRWAAARAGFADGEALDRKYLAQIEDLEHGPERALPLYVEQLRLDPDDPVLVDRTLEIEAVSHSRAVAKLLADGQVASRVLAALEAEVQRNPAHPASWWRLATFFALRPGAREEHERFVERARAVEEAARTRARAIGRALSAAAYRFAGQPEGLIHEVWASREMAPGGRGGNLLKEDILGNVTGEMKESIRSTFFAVREFARSKFPHVTGDLMDYNYSFKVTKDDEPSGGTSAGLPVALAFLSVFVQRPLAQDVAATGVLVADSHDVLMVRSVGDLIHKVEAACHRNLRKILVPSDDRGLLLQSSRLPARVLREVVRPVSTLDEAIPEVFGELPHG